MWIYTIRHKNRDACLNFKFQNNQRWKRVFRWSPCKTAPTPTTRPATCSPAPEPPLHICPRQAPPRPPYPPPCRRTTSWPTPRPPCPPPCPASCITSPPRLSLRPTRLCQGRRSLRSFRRRVASFPPSGNFGHFKRRIF